MSEALIIATQSPEILGAIATLAGLSLAMFVYAFGSSLKTKVAPVGAIIGEAQRSIRRESKAHDTSLSGIAMSAMPVMIPIAQRIEIPTLRDSVTERYAAAGWPGGYSDDEVFAFGLLTGVALFVPLTLLIAIIQPFAMPIGLVFLLLGPGLVSSHYGGIATERRTSITRTMPYVLDLLVLSMRAGASLQIALQRIAQDYEHLPVGTEIKALLTDIEMGITTTDAFRNFESRAPYPVVKLFVDDVVQAEELGRPVAETLESLSDRVRVRRVQDATETAGAAKTKVLIPGMLMLAAALVLLFAPFILRYIYGGSST